MFKSFIKSLEREHNKSIIEAILKGYNVLFENEQLSKDRIIFDPNIIKRVFPIKFLNTPDNCRCGCMALSVIQSEPDWVVLIRGLRRDDDLDSTISVARGKDLDNLKIIEQPLIQASEKWDELGCEDPTYVGNGFYYTGVEKDDKGDIKANLCFSDLVGHKKLIKRYTDNMDMIKEAESNGKDLYVEMITDKPHIATTDLREKIVPKEGTWYSKGLSTGPITNDNSMFFNGLDDNDDWRIGKLDLNTFTASNPIISGGKICFSSGLANNILFFHFDDKEIWGAELLKNENSLTESTKEYNKFPITALIKQAKKFENFEDFSKFYSIDINHGYYWHLTNNPNFNISKEISPRDMSSMSTGNTSEKGALMITSDLEHWDAFYNDEKITRKYAVLIDASDIEPKYLKQVSRRFGNEIYIQSTEAKKLKIIGIYDIETAKKLDEKYTNIVPQSKKELYEIWKYANNKNINESIASKTVEDFIVDVGLETYKKLKKKHKRKYGEDRIKYIERLKRKYAQTHEPVFESTNEWKKLEKNKVPLTDDERKEVFKKDAVWHYGTSKDPNTGRKVQKVSAVWKSKNPKTEEITYITNTHRAYQTRKSLKAVINIYHDFIKGTA